MSDSDSNPETPAGKAVVTTKSNVAEAAGEAVGMGLFVGLLASVVILLLVRQADLVTFPIPDGLLALLAIVALVVGSAMDTSIVPGRGN